MSHKTRDVGTLSDPYPKSVEATTHTERLKRVNVTFSAHRFEKLQKLANRQNVSL